MLTKIFSTRYNILSAIVAFYFLPLSLLTIYGSLKMPLSQGFGLLSMGLFSTAMGSVVLFVLMRNWELRLLEPSLEGQDIAPLPNARKIALTESLLEQTKGRLAELEIEREAEKKSLLSLEVDLQAKACELTTLTQQNDELQKQRKATLVEFEQFKASTEEKLEQSQLLLEEYQHTIQEQRSLVDTKQQLIVQLEGKVRDLTYEIKTLLQLAEKAENLASQDLIPSPSEKLPNLDSLEAQGLPQSGLFGSQEASVLLRQCIDIAQKITGPRHYGARFSKVRDLSMDTYSLDLRHLSESFNSENSCVVFLYAPRENKLLFINNKVKDLLEWTSEKTLQNFTEIIFDSLEVWNGLISQLSYKNESFGKLHLKAKNGKSILVNCRLGTVPSGLFKGNHIGLFYE